MLVVKIARGAALTGIAASLVLFVFWVAHLADRDPWQWPAGFMCLITWLITGVLVAWHRGQSYDSPQPSLFQPLDGPRTAVKEIIGVLLALAVLLAFNAPFIWGASRRVAKMQSFRRASRQELHQRTMGNDPEIQSRAPRAGTDDGSQGRAGDEAD